MATEISKETKLKLSLETIISLGFALVSITAVYFTLEGKIATAMELPKAPIERVEFDLRIEAIGSQVMTNGKQLEEIKAQLDKLDARLYELSRK
jgi:hypothetical protein|tara:strand:+ start:950 stop:1231 length:282 start_codon:yes stop_codon:yes gene_type:complete